MFLKIYTDCSIVYANIRSHYITMREVHTMDYEEYKRLIIELLNKLEEKDSLLVKQIYTIINQYLRKRGR